MGILTILLAMLLITASNTTTIAQKNQSINGQKTGYWQHKDANGLTCAEGAYENNARKGPWKFYLSESSRKKQVPDVVGMYASNGIKQGDWTYTNTHTQTNVKVNFLNDMMQGECVYFDASNSILAMGAMQDGIRHGKWIFYDEGNPTGGYHNNGLKLNKPMTEGYYKDGVRLGKWDYDYFLDKNTHVKGYLTFEKGVNNGRMDFYKVEHHPTFGTSESLAGSGSYTNGTKTGRWIEFNYGTKGDFIETGNYDNNGNRDGLWKVIIGDQTLLSGSYNNGIPHGKFYHYYENGQVKSETTFNNGLEEGEFKNYYANGNVQDQGTHVIINNETTRDTTFLNIKLPYESSFLIVEEAFWDMNLDYISWLHEAGYSIEPSEIFKRVNTFRTYGFEANQRVVSIKINNKKSVREGAYMSFYEDGGLRLKGNHSPSTASLFDPSNRSLVVGFARDGEWKEYGQDKMLKNTYIYEDGKLKKMLDGNGYIVHTFQYEANGISMVDADGKAELIKK